MPDRPNDNDTIERYDLVIVGAGMGGCALAWALRETSLRICIIERGGPLKQEAANWDPDAVIRDRRYDPDEAWYDGANRPFVPRVYYNYGGSSKFFGGTSFRLRESDFAER
ncbi:MAG: FAD-dependent oxidoreductase, partial [Spirochaetales bacterium]|nr:FAD-dependent oxidoreductase [Spirochaetales bacterium]